MRTLLALPALVLAGAAVAQQPVDPPPAADIIVTATREPRSALTTPASVSRLDAADLALLSAKHQADALNRSAGVYVQRGSGAESLGAIRSPVLTGAGACGAFLVAEDNLPIRPVGFCNLNEMFELNYEQAGGIEVLRGPGSALYGASAVHGIVNLLTPRAAELPRFAAGIEGGSDSFKRLRLGLARPAG
jgi:iron complex outermembrane recepter protein